MACLGRTELSLIGADAAGAARPFAEPGVEPHYAPSRTFRILHLRVRLRLDPAGTAYEGRTVAHISPLPHYDGTARFDLLDVPVHAVTDEHGTDLPFRTDEGVLVVEAGDVDRLVITYGGHTPSAGLFFVGPTAAAPDREPTIWTQCQDEDAKLFMPCHDHPGVKHPWTIELEAPAGLTTLSNGELVREEDLDDGWVRTVWEQEGPMPAYLFTAVAAPLHVTTDTWNDVPVRYLVPPGAEEPVERTFGLTPQMIDVFSGFTGVAYPWPRYDQVVVHDFVFGGMENTACTSMTDLLLVDTKVGVHWDPERLVSHELAHQWFGDLVTCRDWSQGWLNESWATFMETVWEDHRHGPEHTSWYAYEQFRLYLGEDGGRYRRPLVTYRFREPIDVFDRHLYEKGAVILRTLRAELGDDAFRAGVQHYLSKHAGGAVHGRDFVHAMEDATGANLDRFVHQWVEGAGHPVLEIALGEDAGLVTLGVKQTQTGDETAEVFHLRLPVEIVLTSGKVVQVTLPIQERERAWAVPVAGDVQTVRVDPRFQVLAEVTLSGPQPWLEALAADPWPVLAARAVKALAKKGTPSARRAVVGTLTAEVAWGVACEAAKALGADGTSEAVSALVAALQDVSLDPRVRVACAEALGTPAADAAVVEALVALATAADLPTWHLEAAALQALGTTRAAAARAVLQAALDRGSWGDVVAKGALMGLAATQDADVLDDLLGFLASPRDDRAQAAAASALGALGAKVEAVRPRCREALEGLLPDAGFRTQLSALSALGQCGDGAALPTLDRWHRSAPDGRVRRTAYEAAARLRAGTKAPEALSNLQGDLERLQAAQRKLVERLDKLESPPTA